MCGLRCALMSITRCSLLLIHHTLASGDLSDVDVLCDMDTTDRLQSYECCCGPCAGGEKRLQSLTKMVALQRRKLWCNLGEDHPSRQRAKTVMCVIN